MRVLSRGTSVERTEGSLETHSRAPESVGQHIVCERHNLVSARMKIAMHVADEMTNACRFSEVARMDDEHILVRSADDIGSFGVVVKKLSGMKNRAGRQFEREHHTIRRFDETSHSTSIDRAHRQLDDRQAGRRLTMGMEDAHWYWRR